MAQSPVVRRSSGNDPKKIIARVRALSQAAAHTRNSEMGIWATRPELPPQPTQAPELAPPPPFEKCRKAESWKLELECQAVVVPLVKNLSQKMFETEPE